MRKTITVIMLVVTAAVAVAEKPPLDVKLVPVGTYSTGIFDDGAAQIVDYHAASKRLFVTNIGDETIDILEIDSLGNPQLSSQIELDGPPLSVAINPVLDIVAVSIEADEATDPGSVEFFDVEGVSLGDSVEVGSLPDMVVWTPDGSKLLVANEGEPTNTQYEAECEIVEGMVVFETFVDPEGSVSIITIGEDGTIADIQEVNFEVTLGGELLTKELLLSKGVRIFAPAPILVRESEIIDGEIELGEVLETGPEPTCAMDIEPEYITIDENSEIAWVTLQENNAVAVIDIASAAVIDIFSFGTKNHMVTGNGFDASNKDKTINIQNWPAQGMYQPDGIANYTVTEDDGSVRTYLVTANEGDARDFSEDRVGSLDMADSGIASAVKDIQGKTALGRLKCTTAFPAQIDTEGKFLNVISYGGRSFSIWTEDAQLVFDSGDDFERIMAEKYPDAFNSTDDETDFDDRSDDKGPEPEDVELGVIGDNTVAFISLERMGGVMAYDITDPAAPRFLDYVNNRNFKEQSVIKDAEGEEAANPRAGDLSTEGMVFISAADSPTGQALLAVANEISGTTTVFMVVTNGSKK